MTTERSPRRSRRRPGGEGLAYLLILPAVLFELVVHLVPIAIGIVTSLLCLDQFSLRDWTHAPFAGLANYRAGLDPQTAIGSELVTSLWRTGLYAVIVVTVSWGLGLFAAVLLANPFRGRAFFQVFLVLPFALPAYATVLGWRFIFGRDNGMLNHLVVDNLHLRSTRPFWLIGDNAFWATVIVAIWRLWPFAYLVLAAALRNIPADQYRAAALDGASGWQQFGHITLPAIGRANRLVVLVMGMWSFTDFTTPYLLFDAQPPPSATLLGNLIYRNAFVDFNVGLASAMNVLVAVLLLLIGSAYVRRFLPRGDVDA